MQARVLLPLAVVEPFTYAVPAAMESKIKVGMRAYVALGKHKYYVGIVSELGDVITPDANYQLKEILYLPDEEPLVTTEELLFWNRLASYYMATAGDFLAMALPAIALPDGQRNLIINRALLSSFAVQNDKEQKVKELLTDFPKDTLSFDSYVSLCGRGAVSLFQRLYNEGVLTDAEDIKDSTPPLGIPYISIAEEFRNDEALSDIEKQLKRRPAQLALLLHILHLLHNEEQGFSGTVALRDVIQKDVNRRAAWKKLTQFFPNLFVETRALPPLQTLTCQEASFPSIATSPLSLSTEQPTLYEAKDYDDMYQMLSRQILSVLQEGKRVLLLLPQSNGPEGHPDLMRELLGLPQVPVLVLTGNTSQRQRLEIRRRLLHSEEPLLIVGTRPAIFIPANNLGLIAVADEHDAFYKQQEPNPRYHARDALLLRAHSLGIPILLTDVTPSLEAYYNADHGKFHLIRKPQDVEPHSLRFRVIDLARERETKRLNWEHILSQPLVKAIGSTVSSGGKVLLLASRKGYASYLHCFECGENIKCRFCDVTLTYYKRTNELVCPYCGYEQPVLSVCPTCVAQGEGRTGNLKQIGYGSERMEAELTEHFPEATLLRIDGESTRNKGDREDIRKQLIEGDTDIYIGTSLVTRYEFLGDIRLVAVPQVDLLLSFPDFRTDEQLIATLWGLARKYPEATLLLQALDTKHPFFEYLQQPEYRSIANQLLAEREMFTFPPYARMLTLILRTKQLPDLLSTAEQLTQMLRQYVVYFEEVYGPIEPPVSFVRMHYIRHISLRLHPVANSNALRQTIRQCWNSLRSQSLSARRTHLFFDVDPY